LESLKQTLWALQISICQGSPISSPPLVVSQPTQFRHPRSSYGQVARRFEEDRRG
jgi:hypothetical protein